MQPYMMWDPMLKGFASAVTGGMTSLPGSIFGAYIIGIVENLFGGYISIGFKSVVAFFIIVLVLCLRPSGLFGRIDYSPYDPNDVYCRQGQKEVFIIQCLKGGRYKRLTDWFEPT